MRFILLILLLTSCASYRLVSLFPDIRNHLIGKNLEYVETSSYLANFPEVSSINRKNYLIKTYKKSWANKVCDSDTTYNEYLNISDTTTSCSMDKGYCGIKLVFKNGIIRDVQNISTSRNCLAKQVKETE